MAKRKSVDRQDAYAKITGKAKYVNDLSFPGMLYVQTVRIPVAHARIKKIDSTEALQLNGVIGVYTAQDVPGINQKPKDRPVLAAHETKYAGDGVAIVVAETKEQAIKGAKLVKIDFEELPYVMNPEDALKEGAPILHGETNFAASHQAIKGNVEAGFAAADLIIEREYTTQRAMHSAIEPDGAIAIPEANGILLYCPGKGPFNIKRAVASHCGLHENQVRVIQPALGGVFGGKDSDINVIGARVTMAAMLTNRPCKMIWSREEVLEEGTKRHPFKLHYKVGAKRDGKITAMEINGLVDVGAYLTKSAATVWRATVEATGPYNIENIFTRIEGAFTNNTVSDAVRGFGSPQVDFASESLMNELAKELGLDPLKIRRINGFTEGSITATGQKLECVNLMACLDKLEETFPVNKKPSDVPVGKVRGRGISCIFRGEAMGAGFKEKDAAAVNFNVEKDGTIVVYSGITEQGQGGSNVVLQIISDTMGVDIENIKMSPLDTSYVIDSGATVGSRGTITSGNAALVAANDAKMRIATVLAEMWKVNPEMIIFRDNRVFIEDQTHCLSFKDAVNLCYTVIPGVYGHGWWSLPPVWWDFDSNSGETYASFNYGACGAEVEIDLVSGKVEVTEVVAIHDVGRIINEEEAKAQIAGGVSMALGLALSETITTRNGGLVTTNFDKYLLQTVMDSPNITAIPLEAQPANNPLGVKGVSESSTATVSPAVFNAIENALGIRLRNLPADLESVLAAIETSERLGYLKGGGIHE